MTDEELIRKMQEAYGYTDEQLLAEFERAEIELKEEQKGSPKE